MPKTGRGRVAEAQPPATKTGRGRATEAQPPATRTGRGNGMRLQPPAKKDWLQTRSGSPLRATWVPLGHHGGAKGAPGGPRFEPNGSPWGRMGDPWATRGQPTSPYGGPRWCPRAQPASPASQPGQTWARGDCGGADHYVQVPLNDAHLTVEMRGRGGQGVEIVKWKPWK